MSDALTGESITIQIGDSVGVPEGGATLVLLGSVLAGLAAVRRKDS